MWRLKTNPMHGRVDDETPERGVCNQQRRTISSAGVIRRRGTMKGYLSAVHEPESADRSLPWTDGIRKLQHSRVGRASSLAFY